MKSELAKAFKDVFMEDPRYEQLLEIRAATDEHADAILDISEHEVNGKV